MMFALLEGRLDEALLIYSALANEIVETDPAVEGLADRCLNLASLFQPEGMTDLEYIEHELSRKLNVVIRPREGKLTAELRSGPTKRVGERPVEKPKHRVVVYLEAGARYQMHDLSQRWPGETERQKTVKGNMQVTLEVPNLEMVLRWLGPGCIPMEPRELVIMFKDEIEKQLATFDEVQRRYGNDPSGLSGRTDKPRGR